MESEGGGDAKKPWPSHLSSHGFFVDPFVVFCQRQHPPSQSGAAPQRFSVASGQA